MAPLPNLCGTMESVITETLVGVNADADEMRIGTEGRKLKRRQRWEGSLQRSTTVVNFCR